jgi:hypothetical protein
LPGEALPARLHPTGSRLGAAGRGRGGFVKRCGLSHQAATYWVASTPSTYRTPAQTFASRCGAFSRRNRRSAPDEDARRAGGSVLLAGTCARAHDVRATAERRCAVRKKKLSRPGDSAPPVILGLPGTEPGGTEVLLPSAQKRRLRRPTVCGLICSAASAGSEPRARAAPRAPGPTAAAVEYGRPPIAQWRRGMP